MVVVHLVPLLFGVRELVELQRRGLPIAKHGKNELTADIVQLHGGTATLSLQTFCSDVGLRFEEPVPEVGLEPTRPFGQRILSPSRLPFRHSGE